MTELDKANQRIAELEAELAAIGAGGVNGPLMTPTPTSGAADLRTALARAIEAEVRKDALEEAAAVAEKATYRKRWATAGINGQAGKVPPCAVAAAIRARGKPHDPAV